VNVELHIEELLLHGFPPAQRAQIAAAVQRELARLIAEAGAPAAWASGAQVNRVDGGSIAAAPGAAPEAVGAQVARAIYGEGTS